MPQQGGQKDDGRHKRRREGRDECVLRREREPSATEVRAGNARHERVHDETERDEERGPTELRHRAPSGGNDHDFSPLAFGAYFDGHFVIIESRWETNVPFCSWPTTTMWRPTRNRSGTDPR